MLNSMGNAEQYDRSEYSNDEGLKETTDANEIQEWVEVRGGTPVRDENGELKIVFDGEENIDNMSGQRLSWTDFFDDFVESGYVFCYKPEDEEKGTGDLSNEFKLDRRS